MSKFGELLRVSRKKSALTQQQLGSMLGEELGDHGFSGAAVSDWERGVSRIHADNRIVLVSLLRILRRHGGIQTPEEAIALLEAGNYRSLDADEWGRIFPDQTPTRPGHRNGTQSSTMWTDLFSIPAEKLQTVLEKARPGPEPAWPRVVAAILRQGMNRTRASHILHTLLWLWIGLAAWILLVPSWQWPFENHETALLALVTYAAGTLILPACIATLVNTRDAPFWQEQGLANTWVTRLYVHQGASIGFHIGYFIAFVLGLFCYNLGLPFSNLVSLLALVPPLLLSYASAHLVPHNLFTAYRRLNLSDGAIFFIFPLVGPGWGFFLLQYYPTIQQHYLGLALFLASATLLVTVSILRERRKRNSSIHVF